VDRATKGGFAVRAFNQPVNNRLASIHMGFERAVGRADHPTKNGSHRLPFLFH